MEKVMQAARNLVSAAKSTTALHAEVEQLEAALVEYDGGATSAPRPEKPARARRSTRTPS